MLLVLLLLLLTQYDDEYTALLGTKLPRKRLVPPMYDLGVRKRHRNKTRDWMNETTPIEYLPPTLNWTASGWVTPVCNQVIILSTLLGTSAMK